MFRPWLLGVLIFTSLPMMYGCGTVRNLEGPLPKPSRTKDDLGGLIGPPGGREIYGGVRFDLIGFGMLVDPISFPAGNLLGAYLIGVDLPLSFVTDTLTLPWTIQAARNRVGSKQGVESGQTKSTSSEADVVKTP